MSQPIRLGISPCPNDTFAFHALMHRLVDWRGLDFSIQLLDIQQLNERLFAGQLDVGKTSYHAALRLADSYGLLPSGSALGFGVGPLLLAAEADRESLLGDSNAPAPCFRVLCPGLHTTATLLFQIFYPGATNIEQVLFSEIMPRLMAATADFGVCIHEGRFTWQQHGLSLVADLGGLWEQRTGGPLPLGGLVARHSLPPQTAERVQAVIRDSIDYALANRDAALPTMRRYAQEFDDAVLMQHVDLYVNHWTQDLGTDGWAAVMRLAEEARLAGVPLPQRPLALLGSPGP